MKVSWLQNSSLGQDYLKIWLSSTQTVFQPNKNYWSFHWISRLCNTNLAWLKVCFFLKMMYFITACKHSPLSWEFQFCFAKSLRMVVEQGISWKPDRVPRIFQYCILFPPLPGRFIVLQKCSLASQVFSLCCNQEVSYTHLNKSLLDSYQSKSGKANICSSDAVSASALLWIHQWAVKYFSNIQPYWMVWEKHAWEP